MAVKKRKKRTTRICLGFDCSMSSIAGAALGRDFRQGEVGPVWRCMRWTKNVHYYDRMVAAAKGHEMALDLIAMLGVMPELNETVIAVEEPWPMGMVGKGASAFMKQQAQIQGAFLGSLLRWGYVHVFEINTTSWRQMVAEDLGITIHHTKWGKGADGKMRSKEWAHKEWEGLEELPDIIESSKGKIPKPLESRAKAIQPADEYDALAFAEYIFRNPNG